MEDSTNIIDQRGQFPLHFHLGFGAESEVVHPFYTQMLAKTGSTVCGLPCVRACLDRVSTGSTTSSTTRRGICLGAGREAARSQPVSVTVPGKLPENAQTPRRLLNAVLGGVR